MTELEQLLSDLSVLTKQLEDEHKKLDNILNNLTEVLEYE